MGAIYGSDTLYELRVSLQLAEMEREGVSVADTSHNGDKSRTATTNGDTSKRRQQTATRQNGDNQNGDNCGQNGDSA